MGAGTAAKPSIRKRTTVGFAKSEVEKTSRLASNLASVPFRGNIAEITPTEKRRTEFLTGETVIERQTKGFRGEFSTASTDQINQLINIFTTRQQEIQRKRTAPGRRQLFLTGS